MEIIRGRLSSKDFSPQSLRYNVDTDMIQWTPDNGATWNDDPADDPRHALKFAKPIPATADIRCDCAAGMVKWLRDFIEYETGLMEAGATILTVWNAILAPFDLLAPWAIFINGLLELADLIFGIGATALTAAFTDAEYDQLQCIFYCNIESDGTVTPDDLVQIQTEIGAQLNTTAALVTNSILFFQGEIGLQNAGAIGGQTGDCTDCDCGWCLEFDFKTGLHGWIIVSVPGLDEGHQVGGVGIVANVQNDACTGHGYIQFYIDLGATIDNIDTVEIVQTSPNFDIGGSYYVDQDNGATLTRRVGWGSFSGSGTVSVGINDGTTYDRINIVDFQCGQDAGNPQVVEKVRFRGFGTPPSVGTVCP